MVEATKRETAALWLTWLCCSRHDVRNDVAGGIWNGVVDTLGIASHLTTEDKSAFQRAFDSGGYLAHPSSALNHQVDLRWTSPPCPSNADVAAGFTAMLNRVDRQP